MCLETEQRVVLKCVSEQDSIRRVVKVLLHMNNRRAQHIPLLDMFVKDSSWFLVFPRLDKIDFHNLQPLDTVHFLMTQILLVHIRLSQML